MATVTATRPRPSIRPSLVLISIASPSFLVSVVLALMGHVHLALGLMIGAHAPLDAYLILLSRYLQTPGL